MMYCKNESMTENDNKMRCTILQPEVVSHYHILFDEIFFFGVNTNKNPEKHSKRSFTRNCSSNVGL